MTDRKTYDAIVLGGGAAGLFCAAQAGQRGKRVLVLDKAAKVGAKILISGGGRCNFTNRGASPAQFLSANAHFAKSALARYTAADFIALVDSYGIAWHEKTLGQLFCDGRAQAIVDMLLDECAKGDVTIATGQDVTEVAHRDGAFLVTANGAVAGAHALVVATGGPSIPKMGASGFAYDLARQFGLKVVEPRPALVPLTLGGEDVLFRDLSGVSAPVSVAAGKSGAGAKGFREAALFTHRGLSGPAVLQASSYWTHGEPVTVNLLPDHASGWLVEAKQAHPAKPARTALREALPARLADTLTDRLALAGELGAHTDKVLRAAEDRLRRWTFNPNGTEGFAKAEVTAGGISTAELSSKTMEAKRLPGLHAVGEAVDVTGWLGGYNFQWAWSSGWAAGQAI